MGSVYRQKGRKKWMLKYYRDGVPQYESSGTTSETEARKTLTLREADVVKGVGLINRRITFKEASTAVLDDYENNERRTRDWVETRLNRHILPVLGQQKLAKINATVIQAYVRDRLREGARPATVNRELAIMKRTFTLAIRAGQIITRPYIQMLEERNARAGFFEREQFEGVVRHLPDWLKPIAEFAYVTGWRIRSEVLPLEWGQVDRKAGVVRLEPNTTKNDEGRTFPYGELPELKTVMQRQWTRHEALRTQDRICQFVFPDTDGQRVGDWAHYEPWRAACKAASVPGRIPHDFRRTAVRNLVRAGIPEKTAMLLTGHKTRAVFDRYDIVDENDLRTAVSKLAVSTAGSNRNTRGRNSSKIDGRKS